MIPTDSLANRLVLVRRELGLSQREAAQRCGVGFGSWQSWENGSAPRNALRDLAAVAHRLNVDREWLMFGGALRAEVEPVPPVLKSVPFSSPIPGNLADEAAPPTTAELKSVLRKRIPLQAPTRDDAQRRESGSAPVEPVPGGPPWPEYGSLSSHLAGNSPRRRTTAGRLGFQRIPLTPPRREPQMRQAAMAL